jgi:hypothetical protein
MNRLGGAVMTALGKLNWLWEHSLGWILKWLLIIVIRAYQLTLSKLLMPSCRFYPSCSEYGLRSIEGHGAIKGVGLTVWRLLRCNPWNAGGLDPVPSGRNWRPDILPDGRPRVRHLT